MLSFLFIEFVPKGSTRSKKKEWRHPRRISGTAHPRGDWPSPQRRPCRCPASPHEVTKSNEVKGPLKMDIEAIKDMPIYDTRDHTIV